VSFFNTYEALWRRIQADVGRLSYSGMNADEGGHFQHDGCGIYRKPEIVISRPWYKPPADEPSEFLGDGRKVDIKPEFFTLAHEYGHYLSWRGETPPETWARYHAAACHRDGVVRLSGWDAVPNALSEEEKQVISDEESLAWKLGRAFIPEQLLPEYDEKARRGVHNHRYRLGLDELWPEDG
jgi:hypothetical protein